jgi:hypothetical protein
MSPPYIGVFKAIMIKGLIEMYHLGVKLARGAYMAREGKGISNETVPTLFNPIKTCE